MAEIISHEHVESATGGVWYSYEWQGQIHEPVVIGYQSNHLIEKELLPWPLERIESNVVYGKSLYVRTDLRFPWYAWYRLRQAWKSTEWLKVRLIATLVVWGVGYIEPGQIIGWHCLRQKNRISV